VIEETPRVFNCFFLARGVEEGVAAENLFRLGERAVGDRDLAVGSLKPFSSISFTHLMTASVSSLPFLDRPQPLVSTPRLRSGTAS
jgi:hypothetical protein